MKAFHILSLVSTIALQASAATTNIIDLTALTDCGTGYTNGWTLVGIDSYSDKPSIRLNAKSDSMISPIYGEEIKYVILQVKSSKSSGRKLTVFPFINGEFSSEEAISCDYSPKNDAYISQILQFQNDQPVYGFRIGLYGQEGTTTAWGLTNLVVITESSSRFSSPDRITIERIYSSAARISWDGNLLVNSWLLTISHLSESAESFTAITNYDFSLCQQVKDNDNTSKVNDLHEKYPEFSGSRINYSSLTGGVLKVSTESSNGYLVFAGLDRYEHTAIEITAMRYAGDNKCDSLSVYYLDDDGQTNVVGSTHLGDEFTAGQIALDKVPNGTAINIGNLDGEKNRRFYIDRIALLGNYTPARVSTNVIQSIFVKDNHCTIRGLTRRSDYLVTVTAIDDAGTPAPPSAPLAFTTSNHTCGSLIYFR